MPVTFTVMLIIVTASISLIAFNNKTLVNNFIFHIAPIQQNNQWYRFITCGFIHADFGHLAFNMISLYLFGQLVEDQFTIFFGTQGSLFFLFVYLSALVVSLLPTYLQHKRHLYYRSLGASGAVSAIVFIGIFLYPTANIGFFIIPPIIPGFIFAPMYLIISAYLFKKGGDNINHSAHIWGALYGIAFLIVITYYFAHTNVALRFMQQIQEWFAHH